MNKNPTIFVTQDDGHKDFSKAEIYGKLRFVFPYRPSKDNSVLVDHARFVMKDYQPGDYILIVGNPKLTAIMFAAALEVADEVQFIQWDRHTMSYQVEVVPFYDEEEPANRGVAMGR